MTQETSIDAKEKTAALLAGLWKRNVPLVEARLAVLERARDQALGGSMPQDLRVEAAGVAHKFAGSLGMFGLAEGTEIARELEVVLDAASGCAAPDRIRLAELVTRLRSVLFPES